MMKAVVLFAMIVASYAGLCPDNRLAVNKHGGKCPHLFQQMPNDTCCDYITTCKSREGYDAMGDCIIPMINSDFLPEFQELAEENGFYKECLHDLHCGDEEYCGGQGAVKYCFKVPAPYYDIPLKQCVTSGECGAGYCHKTTNFCVKPMQPYCDGQYPAVRGGEECTSDSQCRVAGTFCGETDDGRKRCCAKKPSHVAEGQRTCNLGIMALPRQYCTNNQTCAFGGNGLLTKWCDYDTKVCCHYNMMEPYWRYYCPDGYTPLFGQPKCARSSDCRYGPRGTAGMCIEGRCCSQLIFNEKLNHFKNLPMLPFITEVPCDPNRKIKWRLMYCDKTTRKMAVFSQRNVGGLTQMMVKWRCSRAADCNHPNFYLSETVCVNVTKGETYCLVSPLQPTIVTHGKWYTHLGQWFRILDKVWKPIFVIMAIYSYWNYHHRNRLFYELN